MTFIKRDTSSITTTQPTPTTSVSTISQSSSTSTSSSSGNPNAAYNSFVGNTPSTVLFFLALAVGVFIALLFVFFTIRYFVRSKYGLHVYPLTRRQLLMGSFLPPAPPNNPPNTGATTTTNTNTRTRSPTTGEGTTETSETDGALSTADNMIREQLELIRQNYGFDHYIIEEIGRSRRRMIASSRGGMRMTGGNGFGPSFIGRRTGRRGRYSKMKRLTEEQCQILFPKKSYYEWLNGGKEDDVENRAGNLKEQEKLEEEDDKLVTTGRPVVTDESDDSNSLHTANTTPPLVPPPQSLHEAPSESIEMKELSVIHIENDLAKESSSTQIEEEKIATVEEGTSTTTTTAIPGAAGALNGIDDLHYDSGSCAICLEMLEDEDVVRGLICGHVYHAECVDPWLIKRRACCPMCKRDYLFKRDSQAIINAQNGGANEGQHDAADDDEDEDDVDGEEEVISIDLEEFRNDPELRAILHELIPISERVSIILSEESLSHLNLDQRATELAKIKYGNIFKMLLWRLMGISRRDLYNWAVVELYRQYRRSQNAAALAATTAEAVTEPETVVDGAVPTVETESPQAEVDITDIAGTTPAATTTTTTAAATAGSDLHPTRSVSPTDVGEAQADQTNLRDIVEQRV